MMSQKSFRMKFMFWLDSTKEDEDKLIEQIEKLKLDRLFSKTIRDGVRLICDLRAGQTDMLFELFPWVKESLQATPPLTSEQRLQEQIARLEALLISQGNVPIQTSLTHKESEKPARPAGKSLIQITNADSKCQNKTLTQNFMNSMKGLASGFFD
ncbi:MAG: hypothetical protein ABI700_00350 [Chloroflexota bacterium]